MKIFSLPKYATQSPQHGVSNSARDSLALPSRLARIISELQKHLWRKRFLQT